MPMQFVGFELPMSTHGSVDIDQPNYFLRFLLIIWVAENKNPVLDEYKKTLHVSKMLRSCGHLFSATHFYFIQWYSKWYWQISIQFNSLKKWKCFIRTLSKMGLNSSTTYHRTNNKSAPTLNTEQTYRCNITI